MTPIRNLNRHLNRSNLRHTTRMLGGVHRPPPPNYLGMACRALKQVIKLDKRLRPCIQEQIRLHQEQLVRVQVEAALDRVYGPDER